MRDPCSEPGFRRRSVPSVRGATKASMNYQILAKDDMSVNGLMVRIPYTGIMAGFHMWPHLFMVHLVLIGITAHVTALAVETTPGKLPFSFLLYAYLWVNCQRSYASVCAFWLPGSTWFSEPFYRYNPRKQSAANSWFKASGNLTRLV